jgi:large subunit ribosomal protein L21
MYAILETGGKQYKVRPGQVVDIERLELEPGAEVEFDRVLLVAPDEGEVTIGQPVLGAKVLAEVVEQTRGDKIVVFKYKPKVRYRRKTGHRQAIPRVRIKEIQGEASDGS